MCHSQRCLGLWSPLPIVVVASACWLLRCCCLRRVAFFCFVVGALCAVVAACCVVPREVLVLFLSRGWVRGWDSLRHLLLTVLGLACSFYFYLPENGKLTCARLWGFMTTACLCLARNPSLSRRLASLQRIRTTIRFATQTFAGLCATGCFVVGCCRCEFLVDCFACCNLKLPG